MSNARLEFKSPKVIILDFDVGTVKEVSLILDQLVKYKAPIVIFCKWMKDEPVAEIVYNVHKGILEAAVVTIQGGDQLISETLEDLACLFNATLFNRFNYDNIFKLQPEDIGSAAKIDISEHETFFIASEHKTESHEHRLGKRLREVEFAYRTASGNLKMVLEDRVSRLSGNMALIKIGGRSEAEQKEVKDKLTDGLNAVRNVMEYGALPGGGAALLHASKVLDYLPTHPEEDIQNGVMLMKEVLREPMRFIIDNGKLDGAHCVETLASKYQDPWIGYCAKTDQFGNMLDLGVIDSFHNIKNILIDATSVGSMLLTTECVIYRNRRYARSLDSRSHCSEILQEESTITNALSFSRLRRISVRPTRASLAIDQTR